ncbi:MAG: hypothetical protein F6K41_02400 [Symploca sp. SIO3E6]|nr:hypothetical protein [Caldora sp. SIO3E6]
MKFLVDAQLPVRPLFIYKAAFTISVFAAATTNDNHKQTKILKSKRSLSFVTYVV